MATTFAVISAVSAMLRMGIAVIGVMPTGTPCRSRMSTTVVMSMSGCNRLMDDFVRVGRVPADAPILRAVAHVGPAKVTDDRRKKRDDIESVADHGSVRVDVEFGAVGGADRPCVREPGSIGVDRRSEAIIPG